MGMKLAKRLLLAINLALLFLFWFSNKVLADTVTETCTGGGCYASLKELEVVFGNVVAVVALLGGFISFVMVIVGGFKYITAQGDPKALTSARNSLTWAILGLAFLIIAWLILVFIEKFTGVNVTKFCIGLSCPIN